jgi:tetratricopeptide (TPR) repeat protein
MKMRLLAAGILVAWGVAKSPWETSMFRWRERIMAIPSETFVTPDLRDALGQGLTAASMAGFRGVAANFIWFSVNEAWENQQWERLCSLVELCVLLQPRFEYFWDYGAWHLAWNASVWEENFSREPNSARREEASLAWKEAGIRLLERGIKVNSEKPGLYIRLGDLYAQRLEKYKEAAAYYSQASRLPGAPAFAERFVGYYLEKAGLELEAYEHWKTLWNSASDRSERFRHWDKVEQKLRELEGKLKIPLEQRVFPR